MTPPEKHRPHYRTYLLHVWEERGSDETSRVYRFSLVDAHTHQRHNFASLHLLVEFLPALIQAPNKEAPPPPPPEPQE